jgi:hypothetical protein
MKKTLGPIIGFVTLVVGLGVVGLSSLLAPLPNVAKLDDATPTEINPCSLDSTSEAFVNKDVVVQATLYRYDSHILVYPNIYLGSHPVRDCSVADPTRSYIPSSLGLGVWTELDSNDYLGPNSELPELFFKDRAKWEIDVEIRGVLFKQAPSKYGATYRLAATNIKLEGHWRRFTPKGAA